MNPDAIHVAVTSEETHGPKLTGLEVLVNRLGGAEDVARACATWNTVIVVATAFYTIAWFVAFSGVVFDFAPKDWSPAKAMFLSMAWTPLMMLQLCVGALRYGCLTLTLKEAEHFARLTIEGFHARVAEQVMAALDAHFSGRAPPEKPTIQ